jgi:hypothetical protein
MNHASVWEGEKSRNEARLRDRMVHIDKMGDGIRSAGPITFVAKPGAFRGVHPEGEAVWRRALECGEASPLSISLAFFLTGGLGQTLRGERRSKAAVPRRTP